MSRRARRTFTEDFKAEADLYSRMIVGWAMSERIDRRLCLDALEMAVKARRPAPGLIHHSDRGSQYASNDYRSALDEHGMICGMSRKDDCWDNAVAESYWSTLKAELGDDTPFPTRVAAQHAVFEYIEVFYNRRRIHSSLGFDTSAQKEAVYRSALKAA